MGGGTWRAVLPGIEPADGLAELFDEFERCGWYARTRMGDHGVRFWPDGARGKQFIVDTRYPLNETRLSMYREHTGLELGIQIEEGGK